MGLLINVHAYPQFYPSTHSLKQNTVQEETDKLNAYLDLENCTIKIRKVKLSAPTHDGEMHPSAVFSLPLCKTRATRMWPHHSPIDESMKSSPLGNGQCFPFSGLQKSSICPNATSTMREVSQQLCERCPSLMPQRNKSDLSKPGSHLLRKDYFFALFSIYLLT